MLFKSNRWTIIVATILLVVVCGSNAQDDSDDRPGTLIRPFSAKVSSSASPSCLGSFGPKCGDCATLWSCLGEAEPAQTQDCASIYPGKPFCVDDTCTSNPDSSGDCTTGITCTSEGYFPDPKDCTRYYLCSNALGDSRVYQCPPGFVYNPSNNQCKRLIWPSDCYVVNCAGKDNKYVPYYGDKSLYAYCMVVNGVSAPVMLHCVDRVNMEFNRLTQRCELKCRAEGRLPDVSDCRSYYECYRVLFVGFRSVRQTCVEGFIYDDAVKKCVSGVCSTSPPPSTATQSTTESLTTTTILE